MEGSKSIDRIKVKCHTDIAKRIYFVSRGFSLKHELIGMVVIFVFVNRNDLDCSPKKLTEFNHNVKFSKSDRQ